MRIALIVPGGVDRSGRYRVIPVLLSLIERLAHAHQVLVIAIEHEPQWCQYTLLGATVINLGRVAGAGRALRWAVRLRRMLKALKSQSPEFAVLHAFWVGASASLAVAAGRLLRVPVVVSVGGGELVWLPEIAYGGQGSYLGRLKTSWVLRMADVVSACSHYSLGPLAERRSDALWLPYGVDRKVFEGPTERKSGPPWRLLHVASLNPVKDQGTLLRAVRLVNSQVPVELDFIGEDTLGGSVQRLAADLGLRSVVKFHGFKTVEELVPFYHQAHVYVHSSLFESMGAVVLEAAAAGLPTVGTAVGIIAEMTPEAAVAVPLRNPEALAQGILSLLADARKRSSLARAAQQFAQTYDADWTAAKCEEVYARLSGRPRSPPSRT